MASLTLKVTGMTCGHCRAKVEQAIQSVPGVYGAAVDLEGGVADVEFDGQRVDAGRIVSAVEAAGYGARAQPAP